MEDTMKTTPKPVKTRKLQSGRVEWQYSREVPLTIKSMCPDKWLFVDLETGDVWRKRENEFDMKSGCFWRHVNKKELKELKKLKVHI